MVKRGIGRGVPPQTLPDLLRDRLDVVFVGINPGLYSAAQGHYFARRTNRFWPAFSRSRLSADMRRLVGRDELGPEDDVRLLEVGIGFTDVVKVPTNNAAQVTPALYAEWAPRLRARIERFQPAVAAFHGVTGYRAFAQYGLSESKSTAGLGDQQRRIGQTRLFVVPNPSPANFHVRPADQVTWYDRLADFVDEAAG